MNPQTDTVGPRPEGSHEWTAHPRRAFALRLVLLAVPVLASIAACAVFSKLWLRPHGAPQWLWWLAILGVSLSANRAAHRALRFLTPLPFLYQLSLVFPDEAPSRFKAATRSPSVRQLEREFLNRDDESLRSASSSLALTPSETALKIIELVGALTHHDRRTRGHSERVRLIAETIGEELKLTSEELNKLRWAALVHDIGKLTVPSEILNKRGRPTEEEWQVLQDHPHAGLHLSEGLHNWLGEWGGGIWEHHERFDGTGYPNGLRGDQITLAGRIVAVADSYEVMTATRSYKSPMPVEAARKELTSCAGTHFDPKVVRAMLAVSLGETTKRSRLWSWCSQPVLFASQTPLGAAGPALTSLGLAATLGLGPLPSAPVEAPPPQELAMTEPGALTTGDPGLANTADGGNTAASNSGSPSNSTGVSGDAGTPPSTSDVAENSPTTSSPSLPATTLPTATLPAPSDTKSPRAFPTTIPAASTSVAPTTTSNPKGNLPITAVNDYRTFTEGAGGIAVLSNDIDPDGDLDQTSLTITAAPQHGTAWVTPLRTIVYLLTSEEKVSADQLTYQICDTSGACSSATVHLTRD